ncbi:cytidylate kinase [Gracilibacillus ureilyticus]|uniref:Cytidylate kinase n=1 Tax=Gracilibacillus ureilyticus TaxID=531814 RepID=A0A1H9LRE5_9BACI|nr:(d)CMP kinase [Gracilibacillus ureilyticus]SER13777.1 cytidylate kinase [Gracilibacillus ureilyticus]
MKKIAIAIDGPAAAGKSTIAKLAAQHLNYIYIDTGAMYRTLTFKAIQENVDLSDDQKILEILKKLDITLTPDFEVFANNENVTDNIRSNEVTNNVSKVASIPEVRDEMVKRQQELAVNRGVVMDGRDIGTRVIPDAEIKIFLVASVEERAQRRHEENIKKGIESDLEKLKAEIKNRDKMDSERTSSPLKKADDAIEIDTTSLSIEEVLQKILTIVEQEV